MRSSSVVEQLSPPTNNLFGSLDLPTAIEVPSLAPFILTSTVEGGGELD